MKNFALFKRAENIDKIYAATKKAPTEKRSKKNKAGCQTRTDDLRITNALLYQLSQSSISKTVEF